MNSLPCWFGLYDHGNKKLTSVNAGHNTIYLFKADGKLTELTKGGLFLGSTDLDFESEEVKVDKNDVLVFYTDGVPEAMNKKIEFYGDDRLIKTIADNLSSDTEVILNNLLADVRSFVNDADQSDDITCGVIKVM